MRKLPITSRISRRLGKTRLLGSTIFADQAVAASPLPGSERSWAPEKPLSWDKSKEMKLPNSRERQFMQHLRAAGWVKSMGYSPRIIANLIGKGWVECQQARSGRTASPSWASSDEDTAPEILVKWPVEIGLRAKP